MPLNNLLLPATLLRRNSLEEQFAERCARDVDGLPLHAVVCVLKDHLIAYTLISILVSKSRPFSSSSSAVIDDGNRRSVSTSV